MKEAEKRKAARDFAAYWKDKGDEKGESQKFWLSLLRDVLVVEHPLTSIGLKLVQTHYMMCSHYATPGSIITEYQFL